MKVEGSYDVRGHRITSYLSSPQPDASTFDQLAKFVSWILQRDNPKVEITR